MLALANEKTIKKTLIDAPTIHKRLVELASELTNEYQNVDLLTIAAVMNGSFIFLADLVRLLSLPTEILYIGAKSYGEETVSSGHVQVMELSNFVERVPGRHVLILDDIIDSGRTLKKIYRHISALQPQSLKICTLLNKPSRRVANIEADFCGFAIEDHFVVGYGLDFNGLWRNLPYIAILQ